MKADLFAAAISLTTPALAGQVAAAPDGSPWWATWLLTACGPAAALLLSRITRGLVAGLRSSARRKRAKADAALTDSDPSNDLRALDQQERADLLDTVADGLAGSERPK